MHPTALFLFRSCLDMALAKGLAQLGASIQALFLLRAVKRSLFMSWSPSPLHRTGPSTTTPVLAAGLSHTPCPALRVLLPLSLSFPIPSLSHLRYSCTLTSTTNPL